MNNSLRLDDAFMKGFVTDDDIKDIIPEVEQAHRFLADRNGAGNDFLGWIDLPESLSEEYIDNINETASLLLKDSDVVIVIGIGGSYLGAKSAVEMLSPAFERKKVIFAGHNICGDYLKELLEFVNKQNLKISVNVISKSGTTTEPAIAFRVVESFMLEKYGEKYTRDHIVCTTDKDKGALRKASEKKGYRTFVIPDDIGGRFSVLTPVGLLPMACAGIDISQVLSGAKKAQKDFSVTDINNNISYKYAALRNILYRKGKHIEILSSFDSRLHCIEEWWKQLFGESEGKDKKGIFPASCDFTTDLHSMGQWIQDGTRNIFETFIVEEKAAETCVVPETDDDLDNLNYLAGKTLFYINKQAYKATSEAHYEGGVPNATIIMPERNAFNLGQLFYFFEKAVAVSAYILHVNPFNQPGVESYKSKMFKLLGKPGM